jgi:hypothetical protein
MSDYNNDKFNEAQALETLKKYIESTYDGHYSMNKIQSTEFIFDAGHGEGFCLGNIIKYAQRYGKKGGKNTADLLKILHYGIILLGVNYESEKTRESYTSKYQQGN